MKSLSSPLASNKKINYLNGIAGLAYSQDFAPIEGGYYASMDPRTIDVTRNMRLVFDAPPFESPDTQPLKKIYSNPGYKTGYNVFNAGSVRYYTDVDVADPYGTPPYVIPSEVIPTLFKDPMGGLHAYYEKVPLAQKSSDLFDYSFDQDQINWREDLMSKQQEKENSHQWDVFQLYHNPQKYFPGYFS